MATGNFSKALEIILKEEGGNSNDAHDPGGRTSRGIIQREWNVYRKNKPNLPADVWRAPDEDIATIYRLQYWEPYCDHLPAGLDLVFFNTSVNSGRQQAVKELQRALDCPADGMFGIRTKQAAEDCRDIPEAIVKCCDQRRAFYRQLKTFRYFGKGWLARTDRIQAAALGMAPAEDDSIPTTAVNTEDMSAKANPEDVAKPPVSSEVGATTTASSTVGTGLLDQIQGVSTALEPYKDTIKIVQYILIAVAVIAAGFTIYALWHKSKTQEVMG